MCGENLRLLRLLSIIPGTSPHVWGKLQPVDERLPNGRNIPTCVGKTGLLALRFRALWEHPHMCGENGRIHHWLGMFVGTSPHVWGKLEAARMNNETARNIPTCVGKTSLSGVSGSRSSEHPHMCGENFRGGLSSINELGTSPHVWGKPLDDQQNILRPRNIPTCVGKTANHYTPPDLSSEHPHMCGENQNGRRRDHRKSGTSPHVWGKLNNGSTLRKDFRNIPTCVGKTGSNAKQVLTNAEHPHMCGENFHETAKPSVIAGTSPHVWGKRTRTRHYPSCRRNIPTCVGKTAARSRS